MRWARPICRQMKPKSFSKGQCLCASPSMVTILVATVVRISEKTRNDAFFIRRHFNGLTNSRHDKTVSLKLLATKSMASFTCTSRDLYPSNGNSREVSCWVNFDTNRRNHCTSRSANNGGIIMSNYCRSPWLEQSQHSWSHMLVGQNQPSWTALDSTHHQVAWA